jgi:hypothetical protein
VVQLAVEAHKKAVERGASEAERLFKLLAGGVALATVASVTQPLLSRLFARPAPVAMPAYDYVIDIYSDKVVITASDGSTTTLNTISDFNNWLNNVKGKKIRINVNTVVANDLVLTQNEYWIFGEWVDANVYVVEPNTTIVSFAPLGSGWEGYFVTNMSPDTGEYVDVSGFKLFAVYADVDIEGGPTFSVSNISVHILSSMYTWLVGVSGDVYTVCNWVYIFGATLRRAYIYANGELYMENVEGMGYGSAWLIVSLHETYLYNVVLGDVYEVYMCVRSAIMAPLPENTSQTFDLLSVTATNSEGTLYYTVEAFGLWRAADVGPLRLNANEPPPPGVTYSVDLNARRVTVTNSTSSPLGIVLAYRLEVHTWRRRSGWVE